MQQISGHSAGKMVNRNAKIAISLPLPPIHLVISPWIQFPCVCDWNLIVRANKPRIMGRDLYNQILWYFQFRGGCEDFNRGLINPILAKLAWDNRYSDRTNIFMKWCTKWKCNTKLCVSRSSSNLSLLSLFDKLLIIALSKAFVCQACIYLSYMIMFAVFVRGLRIFMQMCRGYRIKCFAYFTTDDINEQFLLALVLFTPIIGYRYRGNLILKNLKKVRRQKDENRSKWNMIFRCVLYQVSRCRTVFFGLQINFSK